MERPCTCQTSSLGSMAFRKSERRVCKRSSDCRRGGRERGVYSAPRGRSTSLSCNSVYLLLLAVISLSYLYSGRAAAASSSAGANAAAAGMADADVILIEVDEYTQAHVDILANVTHLLSRDRDSALRVTLGDDNSTQCGHGRLEDTVRWYGDPSTDNVTGMFSINTGTTGDGVLITLCQEQWRNVVRVSTNVSAIIAVETSLIGTCRVAGDTMCVQTGNISISLQAYLVLLVFSVPGQAPRFTRPLYTGWLDDGQPRDARVQGLYDLRALDVDPNSFTNYTLDGNDSVLFKINRQHLTADCYLLYLTVVQSLGDSTLGAKSMYSFTIVAHASNDASMSSNASIRISLVHINNKAPLFRGLPYTASIRENMSIGDTVLTANVSDPDRVYFSLDHSLPGAALPFACHPFSGAVFVTAGLDFESTRFYSFTMLARDRTMPSLVSRVPINVTVLDVNEYPPIVNMSLQYVSVQENSPNGTMLVTGFATDRDDVTGDTITLSLLQAGKISQVVYAMMLVPHADTKRSFDLRLSTSHLDREQYPSGGFVVDVVAYDGQHHSHLPVYVSVLDVNDEPPVLQNTTVSVSELVLNGTTLAVLQASDPDSTSVQDHSLTFTVVSGNGRQWLDFVPLQGNRLAVVTADVLDFANTDRLVVTISVSDGRHSTQATLTVHILDASNHAPQFDMSDAMVTNITDDYQPGMPIYRLRATDDKDAGTNARILYTLVSYSADLFAVNRFTGEVSVSKSLNSSTVPGTVRLLFRAADLGRPMSLYADAWLTVHIDTTIYRPPIVLPAHYQCYMEENAILKKVCTRVLARSRNAGASLIFRVSSSNHQVASKQTFAINSTTGEVYLQFVLDPRVQSSFRLVIEVTDSLSSRGTVAFVDISVMGVNNAAPSFTGGDSSTIVISRYTPVGSLVGAVTATDNDIGLDGIVTFELISSNPSKPAISLDPLTGDMYLSDSDTTPLPVINITITVQAHDHGTTSRSSSHKRTIQIVESNRPPLFINSMYSISLATSSTPSALLNRPVLSVTAHDPDSGGAAAANLVYSVAPSQYFNISAGSGELLVSGNLPNTLHVYRLTVFATDQGSPAQQANATVIITTYPSSGLSCPDKMITVNEGWNVTVDDLSVSASPQQQQQYSLSIFGNDAATLDMFFIDPAGPTLVLRHADTAIARWHNVIVNVSSGQSWALCSTLVHVNDSLSSQLPHLAVSYTRTVPAYAPFGSRVLQLTDDDNSDDIIYTMSGGNASTYLRLGISSGVVSVLSTPIRSVAGVLAMNITARSKTYANHTSHTQLFARIQHYDVAGFRITSPVDVRIPSNAAVGSLVTRVRVTADLPTVLQDASVVYSISSNSNSESLFSINASSGVVSVAQALPQLTTQPLQLTVQASVNVTNVELVMHTYNVSVQRSNVYAPAFSLSTYTVSVASWMATVGTSVYRLSASDGDAVLSPLTFGYIQYKLYTPAAAAANDTTSAAATARLPFSVSLNGTVTVTGVLDKPSYVFQVIAEDSPHNSNERRTSRPATVQVSVELPNSNTPVLSASARITLAEDTPVGTMLSPLSAFDADTGTNGQLVYGLEGTYLFTISPLTGVLSLAASLDVDDDPAEANMLLTVTVTDQGNPPRSDMALVQVIVEDSNDERPVFPQPLVFLYAKSATDIGTALLQLSTTDADLTPINREVVYDVQSASSRLLTINYFTGQLYAGVDFSKFAFSQNLAQVDARNGPFLSSTFLSIRVGPPRPRNTACNPPMSQVTIFSDYQAGMLVASLTCTGTALVDSYAVRTDDTVPDRLFQWRPGSASLYLNGSIPRLDTARLLNISVVLNDSESGFQTMAEISVRIWPVSQNFHRPRFQPNDFYAWSIPASVQSGTIIGYVNATDQDTVYNTVRYSVTGGSALGLLDVDSLSGAVLARTTLDHLPSGTELNISILAVDSAPEPLSSSCLVLAVVSNGSVPSRQFSMAVFESSTVEYNNTATPVACVTSYASPPFLGAVFTVQQDYSALPAAAVEPFSFVELPLAGSNTSSPSSTTAMMVNVTLSASLQHTALFTALGSVDTAVQKQLWISVQTAVASAGDGGGSKSEALLKVTVDDTLNQYSPECVQPKPFAVLRVLHSAPVNSSLLRVVARDLDSGLNGHIHYTLATNNSANQFSINTDTGVIISSKPLIAQHTYNLSVEVADAGTPVRTTSCPVQLYVEPPKLAYRIGFGPLFQYVTTSFTVDEDSDVGTVVGNMSVMPRDTVIAICAIDAVSQPPPFAFINQQPTILLTNTLDFEAVNNYSFTVLCSNRCGSNRAEVVVYVRDANDNPPVMLLKHYMFSAQSNGTDNATMLGRVVARDRDTHDSIHYYLNSTLDSFVSFDLDSVSGELSLSGPVPWSLQYTLTVCACDMAGCVTGHMDCSLATVNVQLVDAYTPEFTEDTYRAVVPENALSGTSVVQLRAFDQDVGIGGTVRYRIAKLCNASANDSIPMLPFQIDAVSGVLRVSGPLDVDVESKYNVTVVAADDGSPVRSTCAAVSISVSDRPDTPPAFTQPRYTFHASEDAAAAQPAFVGSVVSVSESTVMYSLAGHDPSSSPSSPSSPFTIQPYNGAIYSTSGLDREHASLYTLSVLATDQFGLSSRANVTINISDVNDVTPAFSSPTLSAVISENATVGSLVLAATATDLDLGANSLLTYSLLNSSSGYEFLSISSSTGYIYLRRSLLPLELSTLQVVVMVADSGAPSLSSTALLNVTILDSNEHAPVFVPAAARYSVVSSLPVVAGTVLVTLTVQDSDATVDDNLHFSITAGDAAHRFAISSNGQLSVLHSYDLSAMYELRVEVSDGRFVSSANVSIEFHNDTVAGLTFNETSPYVVSLPESAAVNSSVFRVTAVDHIASSDDMSASPPLHYTLLTNTHVFSINSLTGQIVTSAPLDRENQTRYTLHVQVWDRTEVTRIAQTVLLVTILDINDNAPVFAPGTYTTTLLSNTTISSLVYTLVAMDADDGSNALVTYTIVSGNIGRVFSLAPATGQLTVAKSLRNLVSDRYSLTVQAEDSGTPMRHNTTHTLNITIEHVGRPVFVSAPYRVNVLENITVGSSVVMVMAQSPFGDGRALRYSLERGNFGVFFIEPTLGTILLSSKLDHSQQQHYRLSVRATDPLEGLFTETSVDIGVIDVNDKAPVFRQTLHSVIVNEDIAVGSAVLHVTATDDDAGSYGDVTYSFDSATSQDLPFSINAQNGTIFTTQTLDFDNTSRYEWVILASDGGSPSLTSASAAIVNVRNVNNHPPIFTSPSFNATVDEDALIGFVLVAAVATDADGTLNPLKYAIVNGSYGYFRIQENTGTLSVAAPLSTAGLAHQLLINVSDGTFSSTALVNIRIREVNDYTPVFNDSLYVFSVNETYSGVLGSVAAYDLDVGYYGTLQFSLGPSLFRNLFSIDSVSGVLSLSSSIDFSNSAGNTYEVDVVVQDPGGRRDQAKVVLTILDVNNCNPVFSEAPVAEYTILTSSAPNIVIATLAVSDCDAGTNAQVSFSIVNSSHIAPPFVVDSVTGTLRVATALTSSDTYTLGVRARDHGQPALLGFLTVRITTTASPATVAPIFNQTRYAANLASDIPISSRVAHVQANALDSANLPITYTWHRDSLPLAQSSGFSLNRSSGVIITIRPIPSYPSLARVLRVIAQDSRAQTSEAQLTVTILPPLVGSCPTYTGITLQGSIAENEHVDSLVSVSDTIAPIGRTDYVQSLDYVLANASVPFFINGTRLLTARMFDYEVERRFEVVILAVLPDGTECKNSSSQLMSVTVIISILDTNDSPPKFTEPVYHASITENSALSVPLNVTNGPILAKDVDSGSPAPRYIIVSGSVDDSSAQLPAFSIDQHSGVLYAAARLDFEQRTQYVLNISADDGRFSGFASVHITILDTNDNGPRFTATDNTATVVENAPANTPLLMLNASDADSALFGPLQYSILQVRGTAHVSDVQVDKHTGLLSTAVPLDHELASVIFMTVQVEDGGGRKSLAFVTITVLDVNDNPPVFTQNMYDVSFTEHSPVPFVLIDTMANDRDTGNNSVLVFNLLTPFNGTFALARPSLGLVEVLKDVDREIQDQYTLVVEVHDQGHPQLASNTSVNVTVLDINDVTPEFLALPYELSVFENVTMGTSLFQVSAIDHDLPHNARLRYLIVTGSDGAFQLHPTTGVLSVFDATKVDYESRVIFNISIKVEDEGRPELASRAFIIVNILPLNEFAPTFQPENYQVRIFENRPAGTYVTMVTAVDRDVGLGSSLLYGIAADTDPSGQGLPFQIDNTTGVITTTAPLDREAQSVYVFNVTVTDDYEPVKGDTAVVIVMVRDVNDNAPVFYRPVASSVFKVPENLVGIKVITQLFANDTDDDRNQDVKYSVSSPKSGFAIVNESLVATAVFDYERQPVYSVTIVANDTADPPLSSSVTVTIVIEDLNDNAPVGQNQRFIFNQHSLIGATVIVGCVSVVDVDTNKSALGYRIVHQQPGSYFSVSPYSCVLSVSQASTIPPGVYTVRVEINDGFSSTLTNITIHVRSIGNTSLANATVLRATSVTARQLLNSSFPTTTFPMSVLAEEINRFIRQSNWSWSVQIVSVQPIDNSSVLLALGSGGQTRLEQSMVNDALYRHHIHLQQATGYQLETASETRCSSTTTCTVSGLCYQQLAFNHTLTPRTADLLTFDSLDFRADSWQYCLPVQRVTSGSSSSADGMSVSCSSAVVNACASNPCLSGGM
eukprot:scpid2392/ scgid13049/ Protocadherin Fat 1; Cadherin family member 7; Cadherin-related tumor suppressor homolog; Protein fat homolog; Protocadherin Fat 1, nuclear form